LSRVTLASAERRLEEIGQAHERWTQRLREIDQEIAALVSREVEAAWVTKTLRDFDGLWDAMTEANRRRLLHALVEKIVIDEPNGEIAVHLFDVAALAETPALGLRGPIDVVASA
jgi:site-specific DNA recombinase